MNYTTVVAIPRLRRCPREARGAIGPDAQLERIAREFAKGMGANVTDGGFTTSTAPPSARPPHWYVYEFAIENAHAVMPEEPVDATRWTGIRPLTEASGKMTCDRWLSAASAKKQATTARWLRLM